jgi:hypothetical protein
MNKKTLQHFRKKLTDQLEALHDKNSKKRVTTLAESEQALFLLTSDT